MALMSMGEMVQAQQDSPQAVVQRQLDAYNLRDLEAFMATFAQHIKLYNFADGKLMAEGHDACRELYRSLFDRSPSLHSQLLSRIVLGNKVIDHERITGRNGSPDPVELVMVYEVEQGKIFKATVIRPTP